MHRIRSTEQTITVTVPRKPAHAGIDPYHLLIELESVIADDRDGMAHALFATVLAQGSSSDLIGSIGGRKSKCTGR